MSKDARLTVRIGSDLDEWLGQACVAHGLDKAAFARMILYERKNGVTVAGAPIGSQKAAPVTAQNLLAASAAAAEPEPEEEPQLEAAPAFENPPPAYEPPAVPVDVDALIDQQLAEAEAQGLTAPRPEEHKPDLSETGGVRVIGGRTPPRYSVSRQPGWIDPP